MNKVYDNIGNSYKEEELIKMAFEDIEDYIGEIEDEEDKEDREKLIESVPSVVKTMCELNREITREDVRKFNENKSNSIFSKFIFNTLYNDLIWDESDYDIVKEDNHPTVKEENYIEDSITTFEL